MASDSVQRIKERLSIVDVVSSYVELHQAGKNFKGKSPFTNERTPSFYVSPDRGMYYCFSSNQGGDMFTFIEKMEGVEFKDALKILAQKAGVELVPEDPKKRSERDHLYAVLEAATVFFEDNRTRHPEVEAYLLDRGVSKETIAKWRIGYAPGPPKGGWRELKEYLEKKGYTRGQLLKTGLIKGADAGKEPYDLFRDRVMFPICDSTGKPIAYSGRIFSKDSEAPKYVNSPETELFNKSEVLFGYDKAKQGIRTLDFALVVEGQFDVVLSHQAGYTNAVAVSGTALTAHHVMLLQRLSNRVVLALDADRAGIAAVRRAAELMLPRGMDIKVASMIGGKDPADMVREDVQKFRKIVGSAKHVVEYLLNIIENETSDERNYKLRTNDEVLPLVSFISNLIDQDYFIGVVSERTNTSKDAVKRVVEDLVKKRQEKKIEIPVLKSENNEIIRNKPNFSKDIKENLIKNVLIYSSILDNDKQRKILDIVYSLPGIKKELISELLINPEINSLIFSEQDKVININEQQKMLLALESLNKLNHYLKWKIQKDEIRRKQYEADRIGDSELSFSLSSEIDSLQKSENLSEYDQTIFN